MKSSVLWHVELPDILRDLGAVVIRNTDLKAIIPWFKLPDDFVDSALNLKKILC